MTSRIIKSAVWVCMLASVLSVTLFVPSSYAQQTATDALEKAKVLQRMHTYTAQKGSSPSFVLDPAWPQPLPHHWVIGDVGGIAVDKHDQYLGLPPPAFGELHR